MDNDDLRRAVVQLSAFTGQAVALLAQMDPAIVPAVERLVTHWDGSAETRVEQWVMESVRAGFDRMMAGFRQAGSQADVPDPGS